MNSTVTGLTVSEHDEMVQRILSDAERMRGAAMARMFTKMFALTAGLWRSLQVWRTRHRALAQLRRLSDRSLADMGLSRSQIEAGILVRKSDLPAVPDRTIRFDHRSPHTPANQSGPGRHDEVA